MLGHRNRGGARPVGEYRGHFWQRGYHVLLQWPVEVVRLGRLIRVHARRHDHRLRRRHWRPAIHDGRTERVGCLASGADFDANRGHEQRRQRLLRKQHFGLHRFLAVGTRLPPHRGHIGFCGYNHHGYRHVNERQRDMDARRALQVRGHVQRRGAFQRNEPSDGRLLARRVRLRRQHVGNAAADRRSHRAGRHGHQRRADAINPLAFDGRFARAERVLHDRLVELREQLGGHGHGFGRCRARHHGGGRRPVDRGRRPGQVERRFELGKHRLLRRAQRLRRLQHRLPFHGSCGGRRRSAHRHLQLFDEVHRIFVGRQRRNAAHHGHVARRHHRFGRRDGQRQCAEPQRK